MSEMKIRQDIPILSENLKKLRLRHNMTQEQITAKMQVEGCSISRTTYTKIELGVYPIRLSELEVLRKLYNVSYNELFKH